MKQLHKHETYIMAVGPHPDDVEIGAGGVLYRSSQRGKSNVIIDLTPSQLSTHGDFETRLGEAQQAAQALGVQHRENLMLEDGKLCDDCESRNILATKIRQYKPEIVLMPWKDDRHPDHECAAQLVKNAVFAAGLSKLDLGGYAPHKPRLLMHYMIRQQFDPDIIIPLSDDEYQEKLQAFAMYQSQQDTNGRGLEYLQARHVMHGHEIGVRYGEGFKTYSHGIGVESFDEIRNGFF